jgi:hypothetical protein
MLEQMLIDRGEEEAREYVRKYADDAKTATYDLQDTPGAPDEKVKAGVDRQNRTAGLLQAQFETLSSKIARLRTNLKPDVEGIALKRLADNEKYVADEMARFGFLADGLPGFDATKAAGPQRTEQLGETKRSGSVAASTGPYQERAEASHCRP